ncbi:S9 family peptidase [Stenotrophomonas sp. SY1]|uniref:alpha/beta hydrolase family protein n=1 Tax=Stenotrophomonas sp. SY1 TaxID=477235 RepID=UPI001E4C8BF4|nr:S9 family peptidase [Stenotrophomonas sp. SY1]MCD9087691.1 S9 family peptidase [Stenotrophomonas sp. SY1]
MKAVTLGIALVLGAMAGNIHAAVDLGQYIRKDDFNDIKISPSGKYYAATVPFEDKTVLTIFTREGNKPSGSFVPGRNGHVYDFEWANDERVVIGLAEKFGMLDEPQRTGELYAVNADGGKAELLVGFRMLGNGPGTRIQPKKVESVAAFLVDTLPADESNVVISVWPMGTEEPFTRAEKLDVNSGRRITVARAPVRWARFATDNSGEVRLAVGENVDNSSKLYYRDAAGTDWRLINDQVATGRIELPLGFSADNRLAYLLVRGEDKATDRIVAWDPVAGTRATVLHDEGADPFELIIRSGTSMPIGAQVMDGRHRNLFFDESVPEARLHRSLEAAFPRQSVTVTSSTKDGRLLLVKVWSGENPGDFYLYEPAVKKVDHVVSRGSWIDPELAAKVEPFSFQARDGLTIHGYLTKPRGTNGSLPMVVMPHGGPFGIFDQWQYDRVAQMLASAGYAVLQVNYRGSGNYGWAFERAGARQWGGTMQDDVTDATRWAMAQGHTAGGKICIYGASYGAYAALMGVAKEPTLYQCAAGYVGVYDLPMMQREDGRTRRSLGNWSKDWVGEDQAALAAVSPNRLADKIKVPVFLAAGGEDERAPIEHSRMMEAALRKAGVPVESLYYSTEGHGFYTEPHQREYYTQLLAFLSRHLGGATAK